MTRINLVDPEELSDQHLIAEYREIFMVGSALQRSIRSPNWPTNKNKLPNNFTLNKGHVRFFYNKGKYLHRRYLKLIAEMQSRGMKPDPRRLFKVEQWPSQLYKDWEPSASDLRIVRCRIHKKISEKPGWYRWSKRIKPI